MFQAVDFVVAVIFLIDGRDPIDVNLII